MYLLLNKDTGELKFSNESAKLEEEITLLPCEGMEWTDEAMCKIAPAMRKIFEFHLRYLLCEACDYGPSEAYFASFEDLAPALEYVRIEEIKEMKQCYHVKGAALSIVFDNLETYQI